MNDERDATTPSIEKPYESLTRERVLVYLACPYRKLDDKQRRIATVKCGAMAGVMMARGWPVIAPVVYGRQLSLHCSEPGAATMLQTMPNFWIKPSELYLSMSTAVIVFRHDGWRESTGIKREVSYARQRGLVVQYVYDNQAARVPMYSDWLRDCQNSGPGLKFGWMPDALVPPAAIPSRNKDLPDAR